eukprot:1160403-Pelagomonas_calceolata.AAC.13
MKNGMSMSHTQTHTHSCTHADRNSGGVGGGERGPAQALGGAACCGSGQACRPGVQSAGAHASIVFIVSAHLFSDARCLTAKRLKFQCLTVL